MSTEKIKMTVNEHKREIIVAIAGTAAVVTVYIVLNRKLKIARTINRSLVDWNCDLYNELLQLENQSFEKDELIKKQSSELLRLKSSLGGRQMAEIKEHLRSTAA